jgi:putative endonuclease
MRTDRQIAGDAAEREVAEALRSAGWTILGRDVHVGRAELDLVAIDPGPPASLVIVEVRFRSSRDFGHPEETVTRGKATRLRRAALALVGSGRLPAGTPIPRLPLRIDLVAVEPGGERALHRRNAPGRGDDAPSRSVAPPGADCRPRLAIRHHRGVL